MIFNIKIWIIYKIFNNLYIIIQLIVSCGNIYSKNTFKNIILYAHESILGSKNSTPLCSLCVVEDDHVLIFVDKIKFNEWNGWVFPATSRGSSFRTDRRRISGSYIFYNQDPSHSWESWDLQNSSSTSKQLLFIYSMLYNK